VETKVNLNQLETMKPRTIIDFQSNGKWNILGCSNKTFLQYISGLNQLHFYNDNGDNDEPIHWSINEHIKDICWSSHLNQYILLTPTQLYTMNNREINQSHPIPSQSESKLLSCTCSNQTLLLSYDSGQYE
ncbi:unnamed protein product, partial [Didymodactylos carnosus]